MITIQAFKLPFDKVHSVKGSFPSCFKLIALSLRMGRLHLCCQPGRHWLNKPSLPPTASFLRWIEKNVKKNKT